MSRYSHIGIDKTQRDLNSFYDKIRPYLDELVTAPTQAKAVANVPLKDNIKDEELYGLVTRKEFELILDSYDKQQQNEELKDEAVKCEKVMGNNFSRLLHSKPGFHHLGSTSHLVNDLNINDVYRNSFLNGHSSYTLQDDEDVDHICGQQNQVAILQLLSVANNHLNQSVAHSNHNEKSKAKAAIDEALRINPTLSDTLAVLARYYAMEKRYQDSYKYFKIALNGKLENPEGVKQHYSEALASEGVAEYHKHNFKRAIELLTESIRYNRDNSLAQLHRKLCEDKIISQNNFGKNEFSYRK